MKPPKQADFVERRNAAAAAKTQLLEKMRQAPKLDDPERIARRAEKSKLKAANAAQRAERERMKREADARQQAQEEALALSSAKAETARLEAEAERAAAEQAEQKAERDRRYAARKNRTRLAAPSRGKP